MSSNKSNSHLTYKHNIGKGRYGWVRLTPAYSIGLVKEIIEQLTAKESVYILDPFSGTGTTGLVSGYCGIPCDLFETNPFLQWVAKVKTQYYSPAQIERTSKITLEIVKETKTNKDNGELWLPKMYKIEKWWNAQRLDVLKRMSYEITRRTKEDPQVIDLLKIAFCNLVIKSSNASFNHQSMGIKNVKQAELIPEEKIKEDMLGFFEITINKMLLDAQNNPNAAINVLPVNSKRIPNSGRKYTCVITSPPYCNRMSYVREVRPYMYWLNLIGESKEAADIEWEATGGTWGTATSRLSKWEPVGTFKNDVEFLEIVRKIKASNLLLGNYVHRYFEDMAAHFLTLRSVLKEKAIVHYIIGNSKFFDVVVPAEEIYAKLLIDSGFNEVKIERLRKRTSKKELFEYKVSANLG